MSGEHPHERLNALLDGELPPAEAAALSAHLAACGDCLRTLRELAGLRADIAGLESAEAAALAPVWRACRDSGVGRGDHLGGLAKGHGGGVHGGA
jgi:anti-sigma factor RsiW